MTMQVAGPMFENAQTGYWESLHSKDGGHYNNFGCSDSDGMAALRELFPSGEADELNFVLFSTSGVHGSYTTIDVAESNFTNGVKACVTFLVVQPRLCTVRHGNCLPTSEKDFAFLRKLQESSWQAVQRIGV
ncbi:MAG TPA: hypothetical protein VIG24_09135 [Acidimicrobiia bacterium]